MCARRNGWVLVLSLAALAAALPLRADEEKKAATLAHIKLSGSLAEGPPPVDPLFASHAETFSTKIERIRKAATDPSVQGLYLQVENLNIGWGKLNELSEAIRAFRKSGKKAFAYVESGSTKDYLLGLACDEVIEPESGWLMLTGVRMEVEFYKNLFDKIGVKADMLRMGEAKTAAEPFTRTKLSDASRKQFETVLNDYYEKEVVERIVRSRPARKFTAEQVKKLIDHGPYTARAALKAGLIDRVAYSDGVRDAIKSALQSEKVEIVRNYEQKKPENIDFSDLFSILKLFKPIKSAATKGPKIAVIYANGVITTGKSRTGLFGDETCGSDTIVDAIRQAESDKTVKAIVLRVDSPGGSALASDLMWHALTRCKKPVVASMSDVAASGGYYISMGANKIIAEPGTLTGSIGVVGGKIAVGGLFNKVGITTEVLSRGANANIFSPDKPFSPSERAALTALMKDTYDQFLDKALAGRKKAGKRLTREQLLKLAGGRIWTGRQAKENGLVDELGSLEDALAAAKKLGKLPADKEPELLILPKSKGFLDQLLESKLGSETEERVLRQVLRELPELTRRFGSVQGLLQLRGQPVWLLAPYRVEVR